MRRPSDPPAGVPGLDEALARAGDGAFGINGDARITSWNRAAQEILGYTAGEMVGRRCCEVFEAHDSEGNRVCHEGCRVLTLARMGEPIRSFDVRTRTRAGRPIWVNMTILTVPEPGGGQLIVHLFRDVTATKELLTLVHERLAPAPAAPDGADAAASLSRRELEVLRCMNQGLNTQATATRLGVSRATVRNHVQNIFGKLGVHSRLEAVAFARQHRLL
jgi:PAS domain S-box-containing protein